MSISTLLKLSPIALSISVAASAASTNTTCQSTATCPKVSVEPIDVLVLYDNKSNQEYNNNIATVLKGWENQINTFYANSGVGLKIRFVGYQRYEAVANDMDKMQSEIRQNANIASQRKAYGADFVTYVQRKDVSYCGYGSVNVHKNYAFNVINTGCGALTMAHELGHNMGLHHSRRQGNTGGTRFPYALGYGVQGKFSTIMGYPSSFLTRNQVGVFSNPNLKCYGQACGVEAGKPDQANAVLALNNVRAELRDFMPATR